MDTTNYAELVYALRPEITLTVGLLLVLAYDLMLGRRLSPCVRSLVAVIIGIVTLASATYQTLALPLPETDYAAVFYGTFVCDLLGTFTRVGVYVLSALTMLLVVGSCAKPQRNPAEYIAIQLLATMGFSIMAVSNNLLVAFLGLELASLSLYIMAGFDKTSRASAEAGLKYFLFGGMAAAFMLFGFSLIYGLTGSLNFINISASLAVQGLSPMLLVALVMVLVGFGYKAAAAPFHFWAPDVYQGAPSPAAALIASASKLAGFMLFVRLLYIGAGAVSGSADVLDRVPGWLPVLVLISAASIVLGNIAALAQRNVRRLIAYSAIAHAGALLIGVMAVRAGGVGPLFYYLFTYGLATIGIFGVFAAIERTAPCQNISDLAGLWKRSPFLAGVLFVCVLSLAGVPPLAGFFGKFYVFAAALRLNGLGGPVGWLTMLAIAMSAVGLYYYLLILKSALVSNPSSDSAQSSAKICAPWSVIVGLVIIVVALIIFGLCPSMILMPLK